MYSRFSKYVRFLPVLAVAASCTDNGGARLAAPSGIASTVLTAEPDTLAPETLAGSSCRQSNAFGLRVVITLEARQDVSVQALRFMLLDQFGGSATPIAVASFASTPLFSSRATLPSVPLPLPPGVPIPLPGTAATTALALTSGSRQSFPLFLEFGCGVGRIGTLVATVQTTDRNGRSGSSEVRMRVEG